MTIENSMKIPNLPEDLVITILLKLPVKSLIRFKCVCKLWYSIIKSPFVTMHFESKDRHKHYVALIKCRGFFNPLSIYFFSYHTMKLSSNLYMQFYNAQFIGFCTELLCVIVDGKHFLVINPGTRESKVLKRPNDLYPVKWGFPSYGFGFDPKANDYKLVRVTVPSTEVLTLKSNSWRSLLLSKDLIQFMTGVLDICDRWSNAIMKNAIHWIGILWAEKKKKFIAAFDLEDENFRCINIPGDHLFSDLHSHHCCVFQDYLSISVLHRLSFDNKMEVWVMKEYGVEESWTKQYCFSTFTDVFFKSSIDLYSKVTKLRIKDEDEVIIEKEAFDKLMLHPDYGCSVFNYCESLIPIDREEYEDQFPHMTLAKYEIKHMYNVPKCHGEPLEQYVEKLRGFMMRTWREPAQKTREKERRSLIEWIDRSNESNKTTCDKLKTVLIHLGTQISKFIIDYFMLLIEIGVSFEKKEISETLYEVVTILRCLSLEETSLVINNFVSVVQLFEEKMRTVTKISDYAEWKYKKEEETGEEIRVWLSSKIKNSILRLITIEVLRLETCFCSPLMPTMVPHENVLTLETSLVDVFRDKLNTMRAKIDELMKDMVSVQCEGSSIVKDVLQEVLNVGVKEVWYKVDLMPGATQENASLI